MPRQSCSFLHNESIPAAVVFGAGLAAGRLGPVSANRSRRPLLLHQGFRFATTGAKRSMTASVHCRCPDADASVVVRSSREVMPGKAIRGLDNSFDDRTVWSIIPATMLSQVMQGPTHRRKRLHLLL